MTTIKLSRPDYLFTLAILGDLFRGRVGCRTARWEVGRIVGAGSVNPLDAFVGKVAP